MASTVRPRGPLPARVYWTRRIVVLAVPLLLVVVLARILGGSSDATEAAGDTATQTGARVQETAPTSGPTAEVKAGTKKGKKGKKGKNQSTPTETVPPAPVL